MKKLTAVEWLVEKLIQEDKLFYDDYQCIKQAKELEKKQIVEAFKKGQESILKIS